MSRQLAGPTAHRLERQSAVAERELQLFGERRPIGRLTRVRSHRLTALLGDELEHTGVEFGWVAVEHVVGGAGDVEPTDVRQQRLESVGDGDDVRRRFRPGDEERGRADTTRVGVAEPAV